MENMKEIDTSVWYDNNMAIYRRLAEEISDIIKKILVKNKIPYHSITCRVKEKQSFLNKCKKEKYIDPIKEIMDLSGIRIIAYTNHDVSAICNVIKKQFKIDDENSGDKADMLAEDRVGYLSVHYIVQLNEKRTGLPEYEEFVGLKSEIQVRTLLQHAWAEIEHDKNYKFSGVLPRDIKRRFYLVAGVLEMMDREFDILSKEIDEYVLEVKKKTSDGDFDIDIDSTSLTQYLLDKFKDGYPFPIINDGIVNNEVVGELQRFGFKKISDIDKCLTDKIINITKTEKDETYIGMLRDMMIFTDAEKYFRDAYQMNWSLMNLKEIDFWESNGVADIREYLVNAGVVIPEMDEAEVY